jgi:hypothetical protein
MYHYHLSRSDSRRLAVSLNLTHHCHIQDQFSQMPIVVHYILDRRLLFQITPFIHFHILPRLSHSCLFS